MLSYYMATVAVELLKQVNGKFHMDGGGGALQTSLCVFKSHYVGVLTNR